MLKHACLLACLVILPSAAGQPGVRAQFVGGTVSGIGTRAKAHIDLSRMDVFTVRSHDVEVAVPYNKVHTLEYGQNVSRRYAAAVLISPVFLLSKSRKHFVTIGFTDAQGLQQALVFRLNKGDVRGILASLEARTGRRIEYQDDEARKTGKG